MSIAQIQATIAPLRQQIVVHPLYSHLQTMKDVQLFMQYHVFAVWDFMSLLKALQQQLTCVTLPWVPVGNANTRFLINEIVTGEESDIDAAGNRCSHFELYLEAMQQAGADTQAITAMVVAAQAGQDITTILKDTPLPPAVKGFLGFTFDVIASGKPHVMAAVFTFGREDLIPDMFYSVVKDLNQQFQGQLDIFTYYLERHIEVDGDHHSHLAMEMVQELCGTDAAKWKEAADFALQALEWRNKLWNGILSEKEKVVIIPQ